MNPLTLLGVATLAIAAVAFIWRVSIPHLLRERRLKAEGCCIDCERKLPEGDKGPRCGKCWAKNFPA